MSIIEFNCARKHSRYKTSKNIEIFATPKSDDGWSARTNGCVKDISEEGLGVILERNLTVDTIVMIDFFFENTRITTQAKVIHSRATRDGYFCGLSLEDNAGPLMAFIKAKDIFLSSVN